MKSRKRIANLYCVVDWELRTGKPTGMQCYRRKRDAEMFKKIVIARNKQRGGSKPDPYIKVERTLRNLDDKGFPGEMAPFGPGRVKWPKDLPRSRRRR